MTSKKTKNRIKQERILKRYGNYIRPTIESPIPYVVQFSYFFNMKKQAKNSNGYKAFDYFYRVKNNTKLDCSLFCIIVPNPRTDYSYCSLRVYNVYSIFGKKLFSWTEWLSYHK